MCNLCVSKAHRGSRSITFSTPALQFSGVMDEMLRLCVFDVKYHSWLTPSYVSLLLIIATLDLKVFAFSPSRYWSRYFFSELRACGGWRDDFSWGRRRRSCWLAHLHDTGMFQACEHSSGSGEKRTLLVLLSKSSRSRNVSRSTSIEILWGQTLSFPSQWEFTRQRDLSTAYLQLRVCHSLAPLMHIAVFRGQGAEGSSPLIDNQRWLHYWAPGPASHGGLATGQNFIPIAPLLEE